MDKCVLNGARLCVGAVHHGTIGVARRPMSPQIDDSIYNVLGLIAFVKCLVSDDLCAPTTVGKKHLIHPVGVSADDSTGGVKDGLRRAVVLFQHDQVQLLKVIPEACDIAIVRTSPPVYALIFVSDAK